MGIETSIKIEDKFKKSSEVTYEDLVWLFENFYNEHNKYPNSKEFIGSNNLPQWKVIMRILQNKDLTYKDFLIGLKHKTKTRASEKDYQIYLDRYIKICNNLNRALKEKEFLNIREIPNSNYYVKYCPNKEIKTYDDFVKWCGFNSNKLKKDTQIVKESLISLEKTLGRPIREYDIKTNICGFSMQVINRLYGNLNNAKEKLNLMPTPLSTPMYTFKEYCEELDIILYNIYQNTNRARISWSDIENPLYNLNQINRKTFLYNFSLNNYDFYKYLKEKGFELNTNEIGVKHTFEDGERVLSLMEYKFSLWLKQECGLIYNKDYFKDVRYKNFCKDYNGKMTCDYQINMKNKKYYVEIAGILDAVTDRNDWKNIVPKGKMNIKYLDKMIQKEEILNKSNVEYIFLFPYEFKNNIFQNTIKNMMGK